MWENLNYAHDVESSVSSVLLEWDWDDLKAQLVTSVCGHCRVRFDAKSSPSRIQHPLEDESCRGTNIKYGPWFEVRVEESSVAVSMFQQEWPPLVYSE